MSEETCTHDCSTCSSNCADRKPESLLEAPNPLSSVGHVIAVVSGKGGVGKSMVTSLLAVAMQRAGFRVGILDADVTGPSIPKAFGLAGQVTGSDHAMIPPETKTGIPVMSVNLMLEDTEAPVVWRGPVIAGVVKQFWSDTVWDSLDYLFVDCPPGTGDVPLTVFQSLPVDGVVIVTSPQELVSMIVAKAVNMANMMKIPVLGIIENMSYVRCPDCGKEIRVFGESHVDVTAEKFGIDLLARMPIDPTLASLVDEGRVENVAENCLTDAAEKLKEKTYAE